MLIGFVLFVVTFFTMACNFSTKVVEAASAEKRPQATPTRVATQRPITGPDRRVEVAENGNWLDFKIVYDWQEVCVVSIVNPKNQLEPSDRIFFHSYNCEGLPETVGYEVRFQYFDGFFYDKDGKKWPLAVFYKGGLTTSP